MRIEVSRDPRSLRIYGDDGRDLSKDFACSEVTVRITPQGVTAVLMCEWVDFKADVDYTKVIAELT